jgi:hypothetical protein
MAKTTANLIPTETAWSSKATLQGKSKQKIERGIGVATGASDVVLEVHYPNKSNSVMMNTMRRMKNMMMTMIIISRTKQSMVRATKTVAKMTKICVIMNTMMT